jgi:hypothetical protein
MLTLSRRIGDEAKNKRNGMIKFTISGLDL